jgi:Rrf2 family protein
MQISARVDYALRALSELAVVWQADPTRLEKGDALAARQEIPARFLEGILGQLRKAGIVFSQRGAEGGYRLAQRPEQISVADIIRVLDGPLGAVRSEAPEDATYTGPATHLRVVWVATRAALRSVLESTTLADVVAGRTTADIDALLSTPGAWDRR